MIYVEDGYVKVGGVVLPGIYKSLEIKADALVEEKEVEGSATKPKQATGYEDAKITIEIQLYDTPNQTKEEKLSSLQNIFRSSGQEVPSVQSIISEHTSIRGINQVIFKSLSTKETNQKDSITASLEFWEYIPVTISVMSASDSKSSSGGSGTGGADNLNDNYKNYLNTSRGSAPKISDKTNMSPAHD